jgi:hypothetical protein
MSCGAALTLEAAQINAIERPTPPPQLEVAELTSPVLAPPAPQLAAPIPVSSGAEAIAATFGDTALWSAAATLEPGEAQGSIMAVLALLCVMVSLLGAFAPFLLVLCLLGLALAHGVLGCHLILRLAGRRGATWLESRRWLRWIPWRGSPAPRDFHRIALVALALGYLWLIAIALQALLLVGVWR